MSPKHSSPPFGRRRLPAAIAFLAASSLVILGCGDDEDSTTGAITASGAVAEGVVMTPPTIEEIGARITLTEEQAAALESALSEWRRAIATCSERRVRGPGAGRRSGGGWNEEPHSGPGAGMDVDARGRPLLAFLEAASDILEPDQLVELIDYLAELRDRHRLERGERHRDGRAFLGRRLAAELELSDEQRGAVMAALATTRDTMRDLHEDCEDGTVTTEEFLTRAAEIRDGLQAELADILDDAQLERWQELHAERQQRMLERQRDRVDGFLENRVDLLVRILDLDDAQQGELERIVADAQAELRELLERALAGELAPGEPFVRRRAIRDQAIDAIRAILSDEQARIFDALGELALGPHRIR